MGCVRSGLTLLGAGSAFSLWGQAMPLEGIRPPATAARDLQRRRSSACAYRDEPLPELAPGVPDGPVSDVPRPPVVVSVPLRPERGEQGVVAVPVPGRQSRRSVSPVLPVIPVRSALPVVPVPPVTPPVTPPVVSVPPVTPPVLPVVAPLS